MHAGLGADVSANAEREAESTQVAERMGNAADSTRYLPLYDLVVMNEGRSVTEVVEEIKNKFLARVRKRGSV